METAMEPRQQAPGKKEELRLSTLIWLFVIGSIIGYYLEGISDLVGNGVWRPHTAAVWGHLNIIYGFGAIAAYVLAYHLSERPLLVQFGWYAVSGAAVEYVGSFLQELVFGSRSWDYSQQFLNLNGRVSLKMALLWGLLGVAFTHLLYQPIRRSFLSRPWRGERVLTTVMASFLAVDLLVTSCAILRWKERIVTQTAPSNRVEQAIDNHFDDTRMEYLFHNMDFSAVLPQPPTEDAG